MSGGENNDSADDQSSILSRTPSPAPDDIGSLSKYDEYVRGTPREVITVETKIKPTNKGFAMLTKLGWSEGQPVGLSGDGRVDPIPFQIKRDVTGLGKITQDVRMIETTVSQRRGLDSERQRKETEEQRRAREDSVARHAALQSQISNTLKAFYCTLCDKQFKTVAQYDEHTNSYAHHHKARFKDMQASQRLMPKEEVDKRKEKERKREEKELRKIAAAAGVRMAKSVVTSSSTASSSTTVEPVMASTTQAETPGFKKSGWTSVSSSSEETPLNTVATQTAVKKSGWTTTTPSTSLEVVHPEHSPTAPKVPTPSAPIPSTSRPLAPTFRNAGWTSLDTTTFRSPDFEVPSAPSPPPPPMVPAPPPPPPSHPPVSTDRGTAPQHRPPPSWQQFQRSALKRR